ncbi:AAC(3) family N-acetyltransferase [Oleispirillum naphthae]|uniref:AAC(3) family N-acetyltransferase n=1 Tax=Oleispirillum naphthae TaxID=2838853 RepID=UPI0030822F89
MTDEGASLVDELRAHLTASGIGTGSAVLIHSGISDLLLAHPQVRPSDFSKAAVAMLKELVGPQGTLMMSTDSIRNPREFSYRGLVFDAETMPCRRGAISEAFRLSDGVLRSRHPWCNATVWGRHAAWLLAEHMESRPFAMDRHSPWFRLLELDADIVYVCIRPHVANLCSVMPQHVMGNDYPVGCFMDKPVPLQTRMEDGSIVTFPVQLDVHDWFKDDVIRFTGLIGKRYKLYNRHGGKLCYIYQGRAKAQFDALMAELANGHAQPDLRYWA